MASPAAPTGRDRRASRRSVREPIHSEQGGPGLVAKGAEDLDVDAAKDVPDELGVAVGLDEQAATGGAVPGKRTMRDSWRGARADQQRDTAIVVQVAPHDVHARLLTNLDSHHGGAGHFEI